MQVGMVAVFTALIRTRNYAILIVAQKQCTVRSAQHYSTDSYVHCGLIQLL